MVLPAAFFPRIVDIRKWPSLLYNSKPLESGPLSDVKITIVLSYRSVS